MKSDKGKNKMKEIKAEEIESALLRLGYPKNGLKDAANRMSWVPELAQDMIGYASAGAPAINLQTGQAPPMFLRPLNNGFNVAMLIKDFLMDPPGAFLMGAALITHNEEAMGMLEKLVMEGMTQRLPDGTFKRVKVPASQYYPDCPMCGAKLFRHYQICPVCSTNLQSQ